MKRIALALMTMAVLTGCLGPSKLKADTPENFQQSYEAAVKELTADRRAAFDAALKALVFYKSGLAEKMDQAKESGQFGGMTATIAEAAVDKAFEAKRVDAVVNVAGSVISGKTAEEIISLADAERRKAQENLLLRYKGQLAQAEQALAEADAEAKAENEKIEAQRTLLNKVSVDRPRFRLYEERYSVYKKPIISFAISNNSGIPLKKIFMNGVLQTPGRSVPWIDDGFNYEFPGGLEPGESKSLDLAPNQFGNWGKVPEEGASTGVLSLKLLAVEDASGKRLGEPNGKGEAERRKDSLAASLQTLREKISALEAKMAEKK